MFTYGNGFVSWCEGRILEGHGRPDVSEWHGGRMHGQGTRWRLRGGAQCFEGGRAWGCRLRGAMMDNWITRCKIQSQLSD
jgi:hypothetical protein